MKRITKILASSLLIVGFCLPAVACEGPGEKNPVSDTDILLASGGKTDYTVIIPEEAAAYEEYAAELLQSNFEKATGAHIAIQSDGGAALDTDEKVLSVGKTSVLEDSGITLTVEEMNEDGFKLKTFGNTVVMAGASGSGTIYSVQEFLHYQFGYEVYSADEIYLENESEVTLKKFDVTEIPAFRGRTFDGQAAYNAEYSVALRLRPNTPAAEFDYGDSRDWIGFSHSYYQIIDPSIYNDQKEHPESYHPEWFSAGQLCFMADGLFEEFVNNLKELIKENPYGKIVSLGEMDGAGYCNCDECSKEKSAYGLSGYIVRFMNRVVAETEKDPEIAERDLVYCMFAYTASGSIVPPVKTETGEILDESCRPCDKLYVRVTPLNPVCYKHAWSDPNCSYNQSIYEYFKGWASITDNLYVWDYNTNFSAYYFFYDNFDSLQKNLQFYRDIGIVNLSRENTTGSTVRSLTDLDTYLNAKLMWDPDENVGELTEDFLNHFYKEGAPYMRQYIDLMRSNANFNDATLSEGYHLLCYQSPGDLARYWPKRILEQALELLEKAQETYAPLKESDPVLYETLYNRVLKESVCVRYMIISNFTTYYPNNPSLLVQMLDQFEIDAEIVQATCDHEGGSTSDWVEEMRS